MIELRFHHELYDGFAIDQAVKVYGPFGTMELAREPGGFVVRVTGSEGMPEGALAAELANYALGLTVEKQGAPQAAQVIGQVTE